MALLADLEALMIGASARLTVRLRPHLDLAGDDLPPPVVRRVPTRHGLVTCHVHRPVSGHVDSAIEDDATPVHVHFHGGAFLMRYPQMDDYFCRLVVAETGATVVNVDYDVAPRRRYPVAQEQAHDVIAWLAEHGTDWGLDPDRLTVSGFSAGGNLAASACLQARDRGTPLPRLQLLVVPSLDVSTTDKPAPRGRAMITPRLIRLVRRTYFKDAARRAEPYASPLLAPDLAGLPPAVVITAEIDRLRAEGDAYATRLASAGVPVRHLVAPGRDHYVLDGPPHEARRVLDVMISGIAGAHV